jgi:membrane protease YdiL (CAAX protease family)
MSEDPSDKPPERSPFAPPEASTGASPAGAPAPGTPSGEPSAPSAAPPPHLEIPRESSLAAHHAPVPYQPAQFPPPEGGPVMPYNPNGPPPGGPPPGPGQGYPGAAPPYTPPNSQHPYGAVPPHAYWPGAGYAPQLPKPFPGIGWFCLLVLIGFFGQIVVGFVAVVLVMAIERPNITPGNAQNIMSNISVVAFMSILLTASMTWPAVALVTAKLKRMLNRDTFRIRWPGLPISTLSVVLGLALVPLALLLENLMARVVPRGDNVIVTIMAKSPGALALTLLGLTLVVAAPVGEELLFRGLGYRGIEKRYGLGVGALVISVIFAAVHLNATGFLALFMVSMALCWVTSKTNSLIPAILLHAAYNGVQFLMILGTDFTPEMAEKAAHSTELGIPLWMIPAGLLISLGCLFVIGKLSGTPATD